MNACRYRRINSISGFSLIETLVAMALMGMILASLATLSSQWLPNWNRGLAKIQRNEQIALGLERLSADLSGAEFISSNRETRQPVFEGTEHSVIFVRTAIGPEAGQGLDLVRFAESGSDRGPMMVRTRAQFAPSTKVDPKQKLLPIFVDPVVLFTPPIRLSFSYAGLERVWQENWLNESTLPQAIKLTVRDAATRQILAVSTSTSIHREIPADCVLAKTLSDCRKLRPGQSLASENGK